MLDWLGDWALDIAMRFIAIALAGFGIIKAKNGGPLSWMLAVPAWPAAVFWWRVMVGANLFSTGVFALLTLALLRVAHAEGQEKRKSALADKSAQGPQ